MYEFLCSKWNASFRSSLTALSFWENWAFSSCFFFKNDIVLWNVLPSLGSIGHTSIKQLFKFSRSCFVEKKNRVLRSTHVASRTTDFRFRTSESVSHRSSSLSRILMLSSGTEWLQDLRFGDLKQILQLFPFPVASRFAFHRGCYFCGCGVRSSAWLHPTHHPTNQPLPPPLTFRSTRYHR